MGTISSLYYTFFKRFKKVKKSDIVKLIDTLKATDNLIDLRIQELQVNGGDSNDLKNELKALKQMKLDLIQDLSYLLNNYKMQLQSLRLIGKL
ncbi:hypothetical protein CANARDRAFT_29263, partial [[Candida] arabinofermentans NRRL YB-2248]